MSYKDQYLSYICSPAYSPKDKHKIQKRLTGKKENSIFIANTASLFFWLESWKFLHL